MCFYSVCNYWYFDEKAKKAVKNTQIKRIAIAGGVSANSGIRKALQESEQKFGWKTYKPKFEYTTDNAAMIGIVGYHEFESSSVSAKARLTVLE